MGILTYMKILIHMCSLLLLDHSSFTIFVFLLVLKNSVIDILEKIKKSSRQNSLQMPSVKEERGKTKRGGLVKKRSSEQYDQMLSVVEQRMIANIENK